MHLESVVLEPVWTGAVNRQVVTDSVILGDHRVTVKRVVRDDSVLLPPRASADCLATASTLYGDDEDLVCSREALRYRATRGLKKSQLHAISEYTLAGMGPRAIARILGVSYYIVNTIIGGRMATPKSLPSEAA